MIMKKKEKTFKSIEEIEKYYFPKSYSEKTKKKIDKKDFGNHLAFEILEGIRKQLSKAQLF